MNLKLPHGYTSTRAHGRTHTMCDGLSRCAKLIAKGWSGRTERNTTQACVQLPSHAGLPEDVVPEVPHFRCSIPSFKGSSPSFPASTSVCLQMSIVRLTSPAPSLQVVSAQPARLFVPVKLPPVQRSAWRLTLYVSYRFIIFKPRKSSPRKVSYRTNVRD